MMKILCSFFFLFSINAVFAQYDPAAGKPGSKAMFMDSSAFIGWATGCTVKRGLQNISDPSTGYASTGDSSMAIGKPGDGILSLGDGGSATLTFYSPLVNGPGSDFAVFENSFDDYYLELGFVEVSSDGTHFYRFNSSSLTDTSVQVGSFDLLDPIKLNNLAGKYRALYGTPFDLEELKDIPGLNINHVTHIRIIDVIGSVDSKYASHDGMGRKVNDPWPTAFPSSGFDLDAVGVIHAEKISEIQKNRKDEDVRIFPNPLTGEGDLSVLVSNHLQKFQIELFNEWGQRVYVNVGDGRQLSIPAHDFRDGCYFLRLISQQEVVIRKIVITRK